MKWKYASEDKFREKTNNGRVKFVPEYIFFQFSTETQSHLAEDQIRRRKLRMLFCFCSFIHLST